jgi:hypothetical protein
MLKIYRNCRVEDAGEKVWLLKSSKMDIGFTFYRWRPTLWLLWNTVR